MTKRDVLSIALRILGLIAIYDILLGLPGDFMELSWGSHLARQEGFSVPQSYYIASVVYNFVLMITALIFVVRADRISRKLMPGDTAASATTTTALSETSILTLAIRIIGAYMLIFGIPDLISIMANAGRYLRYGETWGAYLRREQGAEVITTLVLGIILLAAAGYISDLIYGRKNAVQTQD